ncbi:hypothetical protein DMH04_50560 [Kibdelosporangium aridum]|uniref:Uncharacterized protein n=1 Tax=Kibdelosporangium aridum TaxID=2030 RepID=A0A428YBE1_KIBAR|nr:hypothetical protein [Kibdelosporangium aridum]RSM64871.1 hypothetical protein DMH04_50560 [Kibdelosporangium aridum]
MGAAWQRPGPDASAREVVQALRTRAENFTVFADVLADFDRGNAAVVREDAFLLRCQAAVLEGIAELHDELGDQARTLDAFAEQLRGLRRPMDS